MSVLHFILVLGIIAGAVCEIDRQDFAKVMNGVSFNLRKLWHIQLPEDDPMYNDFHKHVKNACNEANKLKFYHKTPDFTKFYASMDVIFEQLSYAREHAAIDMINDSVYSAYQAADELQMLFEKYFLKNLAPPAAVGLAAVPLVYFCVVNNINLGPFGGLVLNMASKNLAGGLTFIGLPGAFAPILTAVLVATGAAASVELVGYLFSLVQASGILFDSISDAEMPEVTVAVTVDGAYVKQNLKDLAKRVSVQLADGPGSSARHA